jgi:electron-transferring-flavoprotein dehydrogenase
MSKGLYLGSLMVGIDQVVFGGKAPWTLAHPKADHEALKPKDRYTPIAYPKPDGVLTFDRLSSVFVSNTNHEEDQPAHLTLKDPLIPVEVNLKVYAGPETRYCPAGVYEFVTGGAAPGCRSTPRTACTARPATSRIRRRTSCGSCPKAAAARTTRTCDE